MVVCADWQATQKRLRSAIFKYEYCAAKNAETFTIPDKTAYGTLTFELAGSSI